MLFKICFAIAGLATLIVAQLPTGGSPLPMTLVVNVINLNTGVQLGTLNGYGNFSSPGPSFPFRAYQTTQGFATINGYGTMTVSGVLSCGGPVPGTTGSFYAVGNVLAFLGSHGTFSVDAVTDAAGGVNQYGRPNGIPVYIGSAGAIPVTLTFKAASG